MYGLSSLALDDPNSNGHDAAQIVDLPLLV